MDYAIILLLFIFVDYVAVNSDNKPLILFCILICVGIILYIFLKNR